MIWVIIAFTISIISGGLLAEMLLPKQVKGVPRLLATLSLGSGIGLGISSISAFLNLLLIGPSSVNLRVADLGLLAILLSIYFYFRRPYPRIAPPKETAKSQSFGLRTLLTAGFSGVVALALISFVSLVVRSPHGRWDAWVLWNTRARILFGGEEHWRDAFSSLFLELSRSPDYPLLLPLSVVRGWKYVGYESTFVPIGIAFLFTLAIVGITMSSLWILRSRGQAVIAGLVLLSTPYFLRQSSALEADVPLMFFFLATLALILLFENSNQKSLLILAGLTAGMAAWTKNEGLLFAFLALVVHMVVSASCAGWRESFRRASTFLVGLIPILLVVGYFKLAVAPSSALVSNQNWLTTIGRITDPTRYLEILRALVSHGYGLGDWYIHPLLLIVLYPICLGFRLAKQEIPGAITAMLVLTLMLGGYLLTYLITPYVLDWHLSTSLSRLLLQLWPSLILLYFFITRTPEEAFEWDENKTGLRNLKGASNYV